MTFRSLQLYIFVYINTDSASWSLWWKFDFLLFPGWPSALSFATSAVLVASVTAVDISVLLLFSLSVLRVCSTFFGWWWNQRFHCSTVSSAWKRRNSGICPGTVEKDIWKSHLNGQKNLKMKTEVHCFSHRDLISLQDDVSFLIKFNQTMFPIWFGIEIKFDVKNKWCYSSSPTLRRISDPQSWIIKACAFLSVPLHTDSRKVKTQN